VEAWLVGIQQVVAVAVAFIHRIITMHSSVASFLVAVLLAAPAATSLNAQTREPSRGSSARDSITVARRGAQPPNPVASSNFTGVVRVESLFDSVASSRAYGASVAFDAGARTSWHTHANGQMLIVTAGIGRVQQWGAAAEEIRPGDVVRIPSNVKHWHGAAPATAMTHIAIVEGGTTWMEPVTDTQYRAQVRIVRSSSPIRDSTRQTATGSAQPAASANQQERLAPVMADYTTRVLFGDVYDRPELSARDRGLVTISVLIATGKPDQLQVHLGRALGSGVTPIEASGVLSTMAIYAGWPSAVVALAVYDRVYTSRNIDTAPIRAAVAALSPELASDAAQRRTNNEQFGVIAPKFAQLTNDVVFGDVWRRPDLSARDRSLVTLSALTAMGDDDYLEVYLRRAVDSGLTRDQITEAFTHVAFYAGWAKASKAIAATGKTLGEGSSR
jgi:4-carboxymuconolactone decarboxylase